MHSRDAVPANSSYSKHLSTDHEDVPSDDDGKKGMVTDNLYFSCIIPLSQCKPGVLHVERSTGLTAIFTLCSAVSEADNHTITIIMWRHLKLGHMNPAL